MKFSSYLRKKKINIDFSSPIDISIPLTFSKKKLRAWGVPFPKREPVKIGNWIGSTKRYFSDIQNKVEKLDEEIEESSIEEKYSTKNKDNKNE